MLYPPVHELKKNVDSKYLVVTLAAKRARELQDHPDRSILDRYESAKTVGMALEEIAENRVRPLN
ncbi:DNA-directed RNA polymerase subunit omega [Salinicoccus halitifaciens]|uniref:DNA-directed RNA polymerase subunit omega n=1 Tax=Salinicoccus halitifaciens TaxID=1073415 RepID=A0ABV2E7D3_9STAP|nr:DNA-directed RNA polymerase subunit omega [Salinicoccus halitifaciens]MCD2136607.1 DNA-directed RNA polymerase subunit omega [Salinicoccus halitifaciens]